MNGAYRHSVKVPAARAGLQGTRERRRPRLSAKHAGAHAEQATRKGEAVVAITREPEEQHVAGKASGEGAKKHESVLDQRPISFSHWVAAARAACVASRPAR